MTTTSAITAPDTETDPGPTPVMAGAIHVLHVEDDPTDAALIQAFILEVQPDATFDTVVRIGDLTQERAAAADCAILDLALPDASGLEALVALRGMNLDLPIIVLTGFDDLSLGLSALRTGAEDYLVKSHVDGRTLQRAIRYAFERRRLTLALIELAGRPVEDDED